MKLKAVRCRGIGQFSAGAAVEGLTGGLDVLIAPNEAGKSTLFRAIETVFFSKFNSVKGLKEFASHEGAAPLIEADFETDGVVWRISKQFLAQKNCTLRRLDGGATFKGGDAEDRLGALAGLQDGKAGRLGFLWVGQGQGLEPDPVDANKRGERDAIKAVIEREVQSATGGGLLRSLKQAAVSELGRLRTEGRGMPKAGGPLDGALKAQAGAEAALAAARAARAQSEKRLAELQQIKTRLATLTDHARVAAASKALAEARQKVSEGEAATRRLADAEGREREAVAAQKAAAAAVEAARRDLGDVARHEAMIGTARGALEEADRERVAKKEVLFLIEEQQQAAGRALADAQEAVQGAARAAEVAEARRRIAAQTVALEAARALKATRAIHEQALSAVAVSDSDVASLGAAEAALQRAEDALAAAAPVVTIRYLDGAAGRIESGGVAAPEGVQPQALGPLTLVIPGIGSIEIAAAATAQADSHHANRATAQATISAILARYGLAGAALVHQRHRDARELKIAIENATRELKGLAPQGIDALEAAIESERARLPVEIDGTPVLDLASAKVRLAAAEGEVRRLAVAHKRAVDDSTAVEIARARQLSAMDAAQEQVAILIQRLPPGAERDAHLARLIEAESAAAGLLREATRGVIAVRETAPSGPALAQLRTGADRLSDLINQDRDDVQRLEVEASGLVGEQNAADDQGLAGQVAAREDDLARASREVLRFKRKADALALVLDLIDQQEQSSRDAFLEPVLKACLPYAAQVLPDVLIRFDRELAIAGIERRGQSFATDVLSGGTKEQIALLVRLGLGRLLAERGHAAPLILDDALVYTDDERLDRAFEALKVAAGHHQVLVLTCHERSFAPLAAHRLQIVPWVA